MPRRGLLLHVALVLSVGCGRAEAPPAREVVAAPSASPALTPASAPPPSRACEPLLPVGAELVAQQVDALRQPERRGYTDANAPLARSFPRLAEHGTLRSMVALEAEGAHGRVFAVTLLKRNARRGMDAFLGFAASPCPGGDLDLLGAPTPLEAEDAVLELAVRVPLAQVALTEIRVARGPAPPLVGAAPRVERSYVVGRTAPGQPVGLVHTIGDLAQLLSGEAAGLRTDEALFGTGFYPLGDGAVFVDVHHAVWTNRCAVAASPRHRSWPVEFRSRGRFDARGVFAKDATDPVWLVALADDQPPEALASDRTVATRGGPSTATNFPGGPAQWLVGAFASPDAARARLATLKGVKATVLATEPRAGTAPPKEPWSLPPLPRPRGSLDGCASY